MQLYFDISSKNSVKNIIFWQNFLSHHQSPLIRTLANREDAQTTLVVQEAIPDWRIKLGWDLPNFGKATIIIQPSQIQLASLFKMYSGPDTTHIFSGIHGYPLVWKALKYYITTDASIGIYSEAAKWLGLKGKGSLMRGRFDAMRIGNQIDFILAIGHLGEKWFRKCNYSASIVYPFAYFVEPPTQAVLKIKLQNPTRSHIKLIFIGQCVYRKGLDILLKALETIKQIPWHLTVIGDGKNRKEFENLSQSLGIGSQVVFTGALPNIEAIKYLSESDILILPSRWDGWGAVVNEALMCGIPVICSSMCGAADLLHNQMCGHVFEANSVKDLRKKLTDWMTRGPLTPELSAQIKGLAKSIEGEPAVDYLLQVLEHSKGNMDMKPIPPWSTTTSVHSTDAYFR